MLTTRLYFSGSPENERDRIFHSDLVMNAQDTDNPDDGTIGFFALVSYWSTGRA